MEEHVQLKQNMEKSNKHAPTIDDFSVGFCRSVLASSVRGREKMLERFRQKYPDFNLPNNIQMENENPDGKGDKP